MSHQTSVNDLAKQKSEKETVDALKEITNKLTNADLDQVSKAVAVSQKSRKSGATKGKKVDVYKEAAKLAL